MKFDDLKTLFNHVKSEWQEDSHIDFQFKNKQYSAEIGRAHV